MIEQNNLNILDFPSYGFANIFKLMIKWVNRYNFYDFYGKDEN